MKGDLKRSSGITILALFVLCFIAWNGLRLGVVISFWGTLQQYDAHPGPLYIAVSGGFWSLVGLSLLWGLCRGKAWARIAVLSAAGLYTAWYWFDRLALQPVSHTNWPFALFVNILFLIFTATALFNHQSKAFFVYSHK